jgi:pimeloyl-ACP methyl ester carboxylesterase
MINELAAIPLSQEGDKVVHYGDQPGIDQTHLRVLATTLKHLDPGVLEYHAEGRAEEFVQGFDLDRTLGNIHCPVLLIQANHEMGGMMTDSSVKYALARLKLGTHVLIKETGHDLGMEHWEVGPLVRVVSAFLNCL